MENIDLDLRSELKLDEYQSHGIIRPYKCIECNLTFERASQFDYHHRSIHLNEKTQLCEICGKSFFRKTDLQTHLNIHSRNNLCICEICGRSFNHISNLIRHCRIHAGVKPYPCLVCGKRFNQINSLARHKRLHEKSDNKSRGESTESRNEEGKNKLTNKKSVEGSLTQRKVIKRQHYCKVCGQSFDLVLLLRQHEKLHEQANDPRLCKISKKNLQKVSELSEHNCNVQVLPNNTDGKGKLSMEDNAPKHNTEICIYNNNAQQIVPLENIIYISSEEPSVINDIHLLLYKSNEVAKNDNLLCIESNRNNITTLLQNSEDENLEQNQKEKNSSEKTSESNSATIVIDDEFGSEQSVCADASKTSTEKLNDKSRYNIAVNIPVNVNHILHKTDSEVKIDEQPKSTEVANSTNKATQCQEPMLRLVQTENGEQFYEFIISNMVEKSVDIGSTVEGKVHESPSTFETNESDHIDQELQRFPNITNDPNYVHYDLQAIDRIYPTLHHDDHESLFCTTPRKKELFPSEKIANPAESHHELLANDVQTEFDRYVETNFEVFEKLSYENSSEQFLELTEIAEHNCQVSEYVEASHSYVQNDSEQLFEFLQVPQVEKNQTQTFSQVDYVQETVSMCNNDINGVPASTDNKEPKVSNLDPKTSQCAAIKTGKAQTRPANIKTSTSEEIAKSKKKAVMKFQCTECEKSFSSSYNYKQHIGTHFADQQKFHCKDCGLSFAWKTTLNKHMANYHRPDGPQRFVCSLCPKVYGTSSQVNEHVKRDHWKHLNHTCSQCGKCFFKKYDLKIHLRTHTGERPYVCRSCGKRFHHRSHIIRHEQIHI